MKKILIPVIWDMAPHELPGEVSRFQAMDLRNASNEQQIRQWESLAVNIRQNKAEGALIAAALISGLIWAISTSE